MLTIRKHAFARAGLIGNPSDGYHGRTIALVVPNFSARVVLYEWDEVEIVPSQNDHSRFRSVEALARDVRLHGYYGGIRLVKATIKKFVEYCQRQGHSLHDQNFSVRYATDIPRQVGLGGSSAIIVAALHCLMEFYDVEIPQEVQPSLALSVETEELGIPAGLQDRVIQVYEGLVFMDFAAEASHEVCGLTCSRYEPLDVSLLPPLYLAYRTGASEPTEIVHNDLRARYQQGDTSVQEAMRQFADLTEQARGAILDGDGALLGELIDANYDLRRSICQIAPWQAEMVERARAVGASAKFAGSGGAIIGTYADEAAYQCLQEALSEIDCRVIQPALVGGK